MNKESTLYDYTKSSEELRQFELGETCSRIIHEYEMFNLQNDVYKMFGEWLLNEAKTKYSAVFTSRELNGFLNVRDIKPPKSVTIAAKKEDYDSCENLRMLSSDCYWDYKSGYKSNYAWYTLWKIAKAYNKQNGCIVVNAPTYYDGGDVKVVLDWNKEAQDCITHEKWMSDARNEFNAGLCLETSLIIPIVMGVVATIASCFFIPDEEKMCFAFFCIILVGVAFTAFLYLQFKKGMIKESLEEFAGDFEAHCNKIEDVRYSRYSIEKDRRYDWE